MNDVLTTLEVDSFKGGSRPLARACLKMLVHRNGETPSRCREPTLALRRISPFSGDLGLPPLTLMRRVPARLSSIQEFKGLFEILRR